MGGEDNDQDVHSQEYQTKSASQSVSATNSEDLEVVEQDDVELKDTNNYVFIIFLLFGFSGLIPWNMFLNIAFDYYTMFKLRKENANGTWYSANFQNSMTISAQLPNLAFNVFNILCATKGDLTRRMRLCLIVVQLMVIFTVVFIYINTSDWIALFFVFTIVTIVILNAAIGLFQNSMFGLASPFPFKYTNALIIGQNVCGTIVTALSILTKAVSEDVQMRAMLFFCLSSVSIVACFVSLNVIKRFAFFKKYGVLEGEYKSESSRAERTIWERIQEAFSKSKLQFFNIFALFFVTLSIFPNVCMYVKDAIPGEKYTFVLPERYFMDIATFLNFNLFAFLGSVSANWVRWPGPNTTWIAVLARFWFIFYFPAANYIPVDNPRVYPVLFTSTWFFVLNISVLAFTSGYFSSLIMMYAPRTHEKPEMQRFAGMIASFFLISGIFAGLVFSWPIRLFITGWV